MEMQTQDYLKKALLEAQEKVRDYKIYSARIEDDELSRFFREYSQYEGLQAQKLREYLETCGQ